MKRKLLLIVLSLCFFTQQNLAQQTAVTGKIVNANNEPVLGATISVKNSGSLSTTSDINGNFKLSVPSTAKVLVVSFVGFKTREVTIKPNLQIVMEEDATTLGEVAVTAEFGMKRISRTMGSSAQNVTGADISESGRESFITALQGRVSGMNITTTSGTPGASTTVVLRNLTSISGNNSPLYVVDGVPMNNSTYDPLDMVTNMSNEVYSVRNMDYSSRGNDINPQDIESVTVLKGAAAAALYGSDASNGAIIITTKKGRAGKGRVTYSNNFAWSKAYDYPEMQTKYANGAYGTTNYYYTARYGGKYPDGVKLYDNIGQILQTGFSGTHNLAVEGGSDRATIRASFSQLNQTGVIKTSGYDRTNFSLAGKAKVGEWLDVEGSMQYTHSKNDKVLRGTDGPLYRAMIWPIVDDMSQYLTDDGIFMKYPEYYIDHDLLNPLFALYKNKYQDKSDRFLSNIAATITPIKNTFLRAQVGWDVGMQTYVSSLHPYYAANNAGIGQYFITNQNFSDPSINIISGYNNKFFDQKVTFSAQVGYHQQENGIMRLTTNGQKFIIPDFQSINNVDVATMTSAQRNTTRRVQAISGQFEFGWDNLAFVTFRARNDWSSTLPVENNSYFSPAVEASFILSDLKAFKNIKFINYFKLRGALAQVGKDAGPLEIDPQLIPTGQTGGGFKYDFTGPNKNLKPEMNTSREIGFEGKFANNRINTDFTYFYTHCADQIVKGFRLSYATGFVLNTMNVGAFNTWGWEAHIDGDIIKNSNGLKWNVGLNLSQVDSKVVELPKNVSEYYNAYTWNSGNIRNGISQGNPITTLTGRAYTRNDEGDILISPTTGLPLVDATWSIIGDREPKLRYGIVSSLDYKGFRVSALFAGRMGATVVNGTKRLMMSQGISQESVDLREGPPVVFNGVLKDGNENTKTPTRNNIEVDYSLATYAGGDEDWLEKDVNYLRLQELRLSYMLPSALLKKTKLISNMSLFVVGNDLVTWTNYSGIDAVGNTVSAAAGGTGGEGYDVWSIPNPCGITFGISLSLN